LLEIDIYFSWQFTQINVERDIIAELGEKVTMDKLKIILDAHQNNMILHAQKLGMKGLATDWNAMHIYISNDELRDYYIERIIGIIDDIRANFDCEIVWGQVGFPNLSQSIRGKPAEGIFRS